MSHTLADKANGVRSETLVGKIEGAIKDINQSENRFFKEGKSRELISLIRQATGERPFPGDSFLSRLKPCGHDVAESKIPQLIEIALTDKNTFVRAGALEALGEVSKISNPEQLNIIVVALSSIAIEDQAPYNREYAIRLLRPIATMESYQTDYTRAGGSIMETLGKVLLAEKEEWITKSAQRIEQELLRSPKNEEI